MIKRQMIVGLLGVILVYGGVEAKWQPGNILGAISDPGELKSEQTDLGINVAHAQTYLKQNRSFLGTDDINLLQKAINDANTVINENFVNTNVTEVRNAANSLEQARSNAENNLGLFRAVKRNDRDSLKGARQFLDNKANSNAKDTNGNTPLFFVKDGSMAALLLSYGADVNATNNAGQTPLDVAVMAKNSNVVTFLKSNGATPGAGTATK